MKKILSYLDSFMRTQYIKNKYDSHRRVFSLAIIIFIAANTTYGQQKPITKEQYYQKADSVMATRMIQKMKALFELSSDKQSAIREAIITLNQERRQLVSQYKSTDDLSQKVTDRQLVEDSVYQSIIGEKSYTLYKEAMQREREQKQAAMAARIQQKFGTIDTTTVKPTTDAKQ